MHTTANQPSTDTVTEMLAHWEAVHPDRTWTPAEAEQHHLLDEMAHPAVAALFEDLAVHCAPTAEPGAIAAFEAELAARATHRRA